MSDDQGDRRSAEAKDGAFKTLLGQALASALTSQEQGQFSLFEASDPQPDDAGAGEVARTGKPGRPPGARNKSTEELRQFVRARYGDPGLKIMELVFADPKALATALGAPSAWDVRVKQLDLAMRMMPYFWQAMPAEVKVQAKGALAVAISALPGSLPAGDRVAAVDPFTALVNMALNQGVSEPGEGEANGEQSNAEPVLVGEAKA